MSASGSIKMRRTRGGVNLRVTGGLAEQLTTTLALQTARMRSGMSMVVFFADMGQDVLRWEIDASGNVTACAPYHGDLYVGSQVTGIPMPGEQLDFISKLDGKRRTLRWPVEAVELRTEAA